MLKEERLELESKFHDLIDKVPATKNNELCDSLKKFNKTLEKYDFILTNVVQAAGRFLTQDIKKKMKKYVDDIIDGYDKGDGYDETDRIRVKNYLIEITNKYGGDRSLLDKILSVLNVIVELPIADLSTKLYFTISPVFDSTISKFNNQYFPSFDKGIPLYSLAGATSPSLPLFHPFSFSIGSPNIS